MRIKTCNLSVKAAGKQDGTDEGVFEALVATWDLDSYGDKIIQGAFKDTLAEWESRGDPLPVIWSHMSFDPDMHIGVVEKAEERDDGLWVRARLDLDHAKAAQVYKLLKGRRVTQFSFAYDIDDGGFVEQKDDAGNEAPGYYELRKLKLYEVGPCLVGVNQETELLAVKSSDGRDLRLHLDGYALDGRSAPEEAEIIRCAVKAALDVTGGRVKAGRVLSAKNETTLREAVDKIDEGKKAITAVLAALDTDKSARPAVKGAIGAHGTATSDATWDGPANEANLSNDAGAATYRQAFAWVDPDGDPDVKASYKFIHHMVSDDGTVGAANTTACTTGIGVLNGGRGGTNIPDSDRQGVYDHLARHLRDADLEPPELSSSGGSSDDDKAKPSPQLANTDEDPGRGKSGRPAALRSAASVRLLSDLRAFEATAVGSE